jgi:hypothetical protein
VAAVVVVLGLLVAGSLRGSDHDFPFGPFRMYATSGRRDGAVRTASLVGVAQGRTFAIRPEAIGLRPAEMEGQYPRFESDPRTLGAVARAGADRGLRLDELRLVDVGWRLHDGRRVGEPTAHVLAVWRRSP